MATTCLYLYRLGWLSGGNITVRGRRKTVIAVLGGGLTDQGLVPPHTELRLQKAVELYRHHEQLIPNSAVIITLSGGTPHKPPPVDKRGFPVWEAAAAARRLIALGVPAHHILEENFSLDTVGNAYFLRAVHLDPAGFNQLLVITNNWHMPRTRAIFSHILSLPARSSGEAADDGAAAGEEANDKGQLVARKSRRSSHVRRSSKSTNMVNDLASSLDSSSGGSSAMSSPPATAALVPSEISFDAESSTTASSISTSHSGIQVSFVSVAAGVADADVLSARVDKERQALSTFEKKARWRLTSMQTLHDWLFGEHGAYAASRLVAGAAQPQTAVSAALLKSY